MSRPIRIATLLFLTALIVPAATDAAGDDAERIAYYHAVAEPEPGVRLATIAAFLGKYPGGERSDQARTLLLGVVASEGWKEGKGKVNRELVAEWVGREGGRYVSDGGDDPDRLLLASEAYLRAGIERERALELARRGGARAKTMERPVSTSVSSWGRLKKERLARSNYLIGLAYLVAGENSAARPSFQKARVVFGDDPRFRVEEARLLAALGIESAGDRSPDERAVAMEAAAAGPADKAEKIEEYLRLFPRGERRAEFELLLVEAYASDRATADRAAALANRLASKTDNPEVLSTLALLLADAAAGGEHAVEYGFRAVKSLEEIVGDPETFAEDLPALQANLLLARDAYGWALLKAGRTDRAVTELKRAAGSDIPQVAYHYGAALAESGKEFDAAYILAPAWAGGAQEARTALEKIRSRSSELRHHVDDLIEREEDKLRRRKVGKEQAWTAPDFSLVSLGGDLVTLSELRGDVVVLAFWATWCGPCREQLPLLQQTADRYSGKRVRLFGVNTDRDLWLVKPFLEESGLRIETLLTTGEKEWEDRARAYKVSALPTLLLIDKRGTVRYTEEGYDGNGELFEKVLAWRIDRLLGEN